MMSKWVYSESYNHFDLSELFNSKKEAILEGSKTFKNDFYIGEVIIPEIVGMDVEYIIEHIFDKTTANTDPEICSEWLCDVETEHREELEQSVNQVIFEWIEKYNYQPNWFEIDHITLVTNKGGD